MVYFFFKKGEGGVVIWLLAGNQHLKIHKIMHEQLRDNVLNAAMLFFVFHFYKCLALALSVGLSLFGISFKNLPFKNVFPVSRTVV